MKHLIACLFLFAFCPLAFGQVKPQPKIRSVRVTLIDETTVSGALLKIEAEKLHIKDASRETIVELDKVATIEFDNPDKPRIPSETVAFLKRIRALAVAVPGLTKIEYLKRFGDIVADAKDALSAWADKDGRERAIGTLSLHQICAESFTDGSINNERVQKIVRGNLESITKTIDEILKDAR